MEKEETTRKTYSVKGRTFYQKELVLGQLELLVDLIKDIELEKGLTNLGILKAVGSKMPRAMAIVLLEEGCKGDKIEVGQSGGSIDVESVKELTEFFANNVDVSLALRVIADFFICTPMSSIMQTLASLIPAVQNPAQTT